MVGPAAPYSSVVPDAPVQLFNDQPAGTFLSQNYALLEAANAVIVTVSGRFTGTSGIGPAPSASVTVMDASDPATGYAQAQDPAALLPAIASSFTSPFATYRRTVAGLRPFVKVQLVATVAKALWSVMVAPVRVAPTVAAPKKFLFKDCSDSVIAQTVSALPTRLYGFSILNNQGVTAYVQLFDVANAAATLGSTEPSRQFGVGAYSQYDPPLPALGIDFTNGLCVASTTLIDGVVGSAAGVYVYGEYMP